MKTRKLIALGAAALTLTAAAPAAAKTPFGGVHAHRGGPIENGTAMQPENSLEAFRHAHEVFRADVIELDAKLTADNVPVIMHDATLDRTTNCAGQVRQKTAADLAAACRIDTLGTDSKIKPATGPGVPVPTLADVLAWAREGKVKLNLEIKNQPTDPDYDPTPGFAQTILSTVDRSGIDKGTVLIQSFWPPNLDEAKGRGFQTSFLTLQQTSNRQSIELARTNGYSVVSPGWPTAMDPKEFVDAAHAAGKPVIPYTIDDEAEMDRARGAGVDGLITNDPALATRGRDAKACSDAAAAEKRLKRVYRKRRARYRSSRTRARRKSMLSACRAYTRSTRARKRACADAAR